MGDDRVLEFGTAKAGPGERGTGFIKVGELSDGSPVNMPVIILNGKNPGTKLLLMGLEDGDEYPGALGGLDACNNVIPDMLDEMNGSVVFLPAVMIDSFRGNPYGGGTRNSSLDIDQGARPRRPGNPYGKYGAQLGYKVHQVEKEYDPDAIIKFHGCKQMYGIDVIWCWSASPGSAHDNFWRSGVIDPDRMLILGHDAADRARRGLPPLPDRPLTMNLESNGGEGGMGNGFSGDTMRDSLLNVMRHLKMIPGEEIKAKNIKYVNYIGGVGPEGKMHSAGINTTRGGFFTPLVDLLDEVKEGQTIGLVKNFFGEIVEEIKSPIDGFCKSYYCEAPHIGSGQWRVFALAKVVEVR